MTRLTAFVAIFGLFTALPVLAQEIGLSAGPSRPVLGVDIVDADEGGVVVENVRSGMPAEGAGIQEGDRIVRFGATQITDDQSLIKALEGTKPGATVTIALVRQGKEITLPVTFPGASAKSPVVRLAPATPATPVPAEPTEDAMITVAKPKGGGALTRAATQIEKALAALDGEPGPKEIAQARAALEKALAAVHKAQASPKATKITRKADGSTDLGDSTVIEVAPGGESQIVDLSGIGPKIKELMQSGKSASEVQAELEKMFPGSKIKVAVNQDSGHDEDSDSAKSSDSSSSSKSSSSSDHESSTVTNKSGKTVRTTKSHKVETKTDDGTGEPAPTPAPPVADPVKPVPPKKEDG